MNSTPGAVSPLLRLIKGGQHQNQKGHVIVEGQPMQRACLLLESVAQTAVAAPIPGQLFL